MASRNGLVASDCIRQDTDNNSDTPTPSRSSGSDPRQPFYFCKSCNKKYVTTEDLKEHEWGLLHHIKLEQLHKKNLGSKSSSDSKAFQFRCDLCQITASSLADISKHLEGEYHSKLSHRFRKLREARKHGGPPVPVHKISSIMAREDLQTMQQKRKSAHLQKQNSGDPQNIRNPRDELPIIQQQHGFMPMSIPNHMQQNPNFSNEAESQFGPNPNFGMYERGFRGGIRPHQNFGPEPFPPFVPPCWNGPFPFPRPPPFLPGPGPGPPSQWMPGPRQMPLIRRAPPLLDGAPQGNLWMSFSNPPTSELTNNNTSMPAELTNERSRNDQMSHSNEWERRDGDHEISSKQSTSTRVRSPPTSAGTSNRSKYTSRHPSSTVATFEPNRPGNERNWKNNQVFRVVAPKTAYLKRLERETRQWQRTYPNKTKPRASKKSDTSKERRGFSKRDRNSSDTGIIEEKNRWKRKENAVRKFMSQNRSRLEPTNSKNKHWKSQEEEATVTLRQEADSTTVSSEVSAHNGIQRSSTRFDQPSSVQSTGSTSSRTVAASSVCPGDGNSLDLSTIGYEGVGSRVQLKRKWDDYLKKKRPAPTLKKKPSEPPMADNHQSKDRFRSDQSESVRDRNNQPSSRRKSESDTGNVNNGKSKNNSRGTGKQSKPTVTREGTHLRFATDSSVEEDSPSSDELAGQLDPVQVMESDPSKLVSLPQESVAQSSPIRIIEQESAVSAISAIVKEEYGEDEEELTTAKQTQPEKNLPAEISTASKSSREAISRSDNDCLGTTANPVSESAMVKKEIVNIDEETQCVNFKEGEQRSVIDEIVENSSEVAVSKNVTVAKRRRSQSTSKDATTDHHDVVTLTNVTTSPTRRSDRLQEKMNSGANSNSDNQVQINYEELLEVCREEERLEEEMTRIETEIERRQAEIHEKQTEQAQKQLALHSVRTKRRRLVEGKNTSPTSADISPPNFIHDIAPSNPISSMAGGGDHIQDLSHSHLANPLLEYAHSLPTVPSPTDVQVLGHSGISQSGLYAALPRLEDFIVPPTMPTSSQQSGLQLQSDGAIESIAVPGGSNVQMTYLGVLPTDPVLTRRIQKMVEKQIGLGMDISKQKGGKKNAKKK